MAESLHRQCQPDDLHQRTVQAVFEIVPRGSCFMDQFEDDVSDVQLHFPSGECHADVTVCRSEDSKAEVEVFNYSGEVCSNCPGTVFSEYDLVPRFLERNRNEFVVQTYLPADNDLAELVADLRAVSHRVTVLRIVETESEVHDGKLTQVDLSRLTDKQREALKEAVQSGYYAAQGETSLAAIAADLGISTSALSQRLKRAEYNVMTQLVGETGTDDD